jgi:hypothetical protein
MARGCARLIWLVRSRVTPQWLPTGSGRSASRWRLLAIHRFSHAVRRPKEETVL